MEEEIFFCWNRWCDFNAPRSGNDILSVGTEDLFKIVAPKELPHVAKFWVIRERRAFRRLKWPILARAPAAATVVAWRIKFAATATPPCDHTFFRKKRVDEKFS